MTPEITIPQPVSNDKAIETTLERHLDRLTSVQQTTVDGVLSSEDDGFILSVRERARRLGSAAWQIECACDYRIVDRAQKLKGGSGQRDTEGRGTVAAVAKQARAAGVTPNTVFRNARIYGLVLKFTGTANTGVSPLEVLDEKGYWLAALDADDAEEAIRKFTETKLQATRFRVSDAQRAVSGIAAQKSVSDPDPSELEAHIRRTIELIKERVIPECPDKKMVARVYNGFIEELENYLADNGLAE